jgi:Capsule biosynthesis CapC
METRGIEIFLSGGLRESLLPAVWLGVVVSVFFNARLGWPLSGLAVPGFLAALVLSSPTAALLFVLEGSVAYCLMRSCCFVLEYFLDIPPFFGRDRFFALFLSSVITRLFVEGLILPYMNLTDPALLQPVTTVVVVLLANFFWKPRLFSGLGMTAVLCGATTLLLVVLAQLTNLEINAGELARMTRIDGLAQESTSYLFLLVVALIASRINFLFGWDFGGILIPALTALQLVEPITLITTICFAIGTATTGYLLLRLPFTRGWNITGGRITLLFFTIDLSLRIVADLCISRLAPGMPSVAMSSFGYLVTALFALRINEEGSILRTFIPIFITAALGCTVAWIIGLLALVTPWREIDSMEAFEDSVISTLVTSNHVQPSQLLLTIPSGNESVVTQVRSIGRTNLHAPLCTQSSHSLHCFGGHNTEFVWDVPSERPAVLRIERKERQTEGGYDLFVSADRQVIEKLLLARHLFSIGIINRLTVYRPDLTIQQVKKFLAVNKSRPQPLSLIIETCTVACSTTLRSRIAPDSNRLLAFLSTPPLRDLQVFPTNSEADVLTVSVEVLKRWIEETTKLSTSLLSVKNDFFSKAPISNPRIVNPALKELVLSELRALIQQKLSNFSKDSPFFGAAALLGLGVSTTPNGERLTLTIPGYGVIIVHPAAPNNQLLLIENGDISLPFLLPIASRMKPRVFVAFHSSRSEQEASILSHLPHSRSIIRDWIDEIQDDISGNLIIFNSVSDNLSVTSLSTVRQYVREVPSLHNNKSTVTVKLNRSEFSSLEYLRSYDQLLLLLNAEGIPLLQEELISFMKRSNLKITPSTLDPRIYEKNPLRCALMQFRSSPTLTIQAIEDLFKVLPKSTRALADSQSKVIFLIIPAPQPHHTRYISVVPLHIPNVLTIGTDPFDCGQDPFMHHPAENEGNNEKSIVDSIEEVFFTPTFTVYPLPKRIV